MTISHTDLVRALRKPGAALLQEATPKKLDLNHMVMGLAGEAGELLDAVKRYTMYDKQIDMANVLEELGDIEFYLEGIRQILSVSRDETLVGNVAKLSKRYESLTYTNAAAQDRADKA